MPQAPLCNPWIRQVTQVQSDRVISGVCRIGGPVRAWCVPWTQS